MFLATAAATSCIAGPPWTRMNPSHGSAKGLQDPKTTGFQTTVTFLVTFASGNLRCTLSVICARSYLRTTGCIISEPCGDEGCSRCPRAMARRCCKVLAWTHVRRFAQLDENYAEAIRNTAWQRSRHSSCAGGGGHLLQDT